MIRVAKRDLEKLRLEIDQIATSAFFLETYAMGMTERARRMKKWLQDLETVSTVAKIPASGASNDPDTSS